MSTWVGKKKTINTSTSFLKWKITSPWRRDSNFDMTPTPTAQPMIGTATLFMRINDVPAGWSSTLVAFHPPDTDNVNSDHDSTGLCVTFRAAVDWKLRQWKLTAQSTTELRDRHMFVTSNGISRGMVICEERTAWHGLASVFCYLSSVCFLSVFYGFVFDRHDNALEEC